LKRLLVLLKVQQLANLTLHTRAQRHKALIC
jgi:hypothetical protein